MRRGRTLIATLGFAFATVAVSEAQAASPKEKRRHQQVLPTGAEDAPARAAARSAAPAVDPGEALLEHSTRKDTVGLHREVLPDGSTRVNLDDRFHAVARVVPGENGTTKVVCGGKAEASKKAKGNAAPQAPKTAALEEK